MTSAADADGNPEPGPFPANRVSRWFAANARDLPWRSPETSPWQVLISEFMLQQTPVVRVLPRYAEWVARWPNPAALAAEPAGEAIRAWGKLGYPRRAMRLHACAIALTADHAGQVPADVDTLLTLPGVGDYTARAVAAFAFGKPEPVVDINVRRVLARFQSGLAHPGTPARADLERMRRVQSATPPAGRAKLAAGIMELGALVCTARSPRCEACPISADCAWLLAGSPENAAPAKQQKFAGTDRQVRGLLLDVLRASSNSVPAHQLDLVWPRDPVQRERALTSLLTDGLVVLGADERYSLPGN